MRDLSRLSPVRARWREVGGGGGLVMPERGEGSVGVLGCVTMSVDDLGGTPMSSYLTCQTKTPPCPDPPCAAPLHAKPGFMRADGSRRQIGRAHV